MQLSFYKGNEGFQNERGWLILSAGMRYLVSSLVILGDRLEMWQLPKSCEHRQTSNISASFQSTVPYDKGSRVGASSIANNQCTDTGAGTGSRSPCFGACGRASSVCSCFACGRTSGNCSSFGARSLSSCISSSFGARSISSCISSSFGASNGSPGIVA
jgi:hypothetical protein